MLDPAVWGTVAAWFGALGTTGSFMAAAGYYLYDKVQDSKAQARHIRIVVSDIEPLNIVVYNHSDASIYDIRTVWERRSLREVLVDDQVVIHRKDGSVGRPSLEDLPAFKLEWDALPKGQESLMLSPSEGRVLPNQSYKINTGDYPNAAYRYSVLFTDAMARRWRLEFEASAMPSYEFKPKKYRGRENRRDISWWDVVFHYRATKGVRSYNRALRKWIKEASK